VTREARTGLLVLAVIGASPTAQAAEEIDPVRSFGLHVAEDFTLKWRRSIPAFEMYAPGEATSWDPWGVAETDASIHRQSGRLKLGLGVGRLGLTIDSSTIVEGTAARVKIRCGLDLGAGRLTLQLPDVKVTPRASTRDRSGSTGSCPSSSSGSRRS
jgi:hypothetical protein